VFLSKYIDYLTACGYERITSEHQPTNTAVLISELKFGFSIAGMELQERWGTLVKLVYLIPEDRRRSFANKYGMIDHLKFQAMQKKQ
jgi:hypothetical protein